MKGDVMRAMLATAAVVAWAGATVSLWKHYHQPAKFDPPPRPDVYEFSILVTNKDAVIEVPRLDSDGTFRMVISNSSEKEIIVNIPVLRGSPYPLLIGRHYTAELKGEYPTNGHASLEVHMEKHE